MMVSLTTTTRIHFVFPLFMFKFENPSKILITKALFCVPGVGGGGGGGGTLHIKGVGMLFGNFELNP